MPSVGEFISCDWGTSHFRLKWIARGEPFREYKDENGCARLHRISEALDPQERANVYSRQLTSALEQLFAAPPEPASPVPLIISGMASSTIGWRDLPYARAPIPLDGSNLHVQTVDWESPAWISATFLVSGVATPTNMMRGEETEAVGLLSSRARTNGEFVLVLPGTHSKHLLVSGGLLRDLRTYMTGELFAVLSEHSVLRASVGSAPDRDSAAGFITGLDTVRREGLPAALFLTRSRQVLERTSPAENAAFLSGVLIGSELEQLRDAPEVLVGGAAPLRELYARALEHFGLQNWTKLSDAECENAVPRGHATILERLLS